MAFHHSLIGLSLSVLCIAGIENNALAQQASGTTVAVVQSAAAAGPGGQRVLQVQGPVFMGDRVQTGSVGTAQIQFRDETRLVVGPNSLVTIDSFVFESDRTAREISMNAVRGAFRFITGNSRKQAYSIATPTATLGVRGTQFDLAVRGSGETSLALFEGIARVCIRGGNCYQVRGGCAVVVIPPSGGLQPMSAGPERTARLQSQFPFVMSQARLQPGFRVDTSNCGVRSASVSPTEPFPERFTPEQPAAAPTVDAPAASPPDVSEPTGPEASPEPEPSPEVAGRPGFGFGDPAHGLGPPGLADGHPGQGNDGQPSGLD